MFNNCESIFISIQQIPSNKMVFRELIIAYN